MSDISDWENTASGNNKGSPPDHAVENVTTIADLNDCMREDQAAVRRWYELPEWRNLGNQASTQSLNTLWVLSNSGAAGDYTSWYYPGQRLQIELDTPATVYGTIATVTYDSTNTVITLEENVLTSAITKLEAGPVLDQEGSDPYDQKNVAQLDKAQDWSEDQTVQKSGSAYWRTKSTTDVLSGLLIVANDGNIGSVYGGVPGGIFVYAYPVGGGTEKLLISGTEANGEHLNLNTGEWGGQSIVDQSQAKGQAIFPTFVVPGSGKKEESVTVNGITANRPVAWSFTVDLPAGLVVSSVRTSVDTLALSLANYYDQQLTADVTMNYMVF